MVESRCNDRDLKMCYWDEARAVTVHCFEAGKAKCRCGKKVVRQPVKRYRMEYGGKSNNPDFFD